ATLTTAINSLTGLSASINNNQMTVAPKDPSSTVAFTNLTGTDFKGTLGLNDIQILGGTLSADPGTPLGGLEMIYSGSGHDNMTVDVTQGIGDQMYNTLSNFLTPTTGLIDEEISSLNTENTNTQTDVDNMNAQITTYQQDLLNQYSQLESFISQ